MVIPRARTVIITVLLFSTLSLSVFGRSLNNEFVTWDDMPLIVDNDNVQSLSATTLKNVFSSYDPELYIPLTLVSYQVNHAIGGLDPFIYHATDLVLHTANALLVTLFLWLLLGSTSISIFLGLIFLLHPINVETVVWASARKDTLSTLFFLSSVIAYLQWRAGRSLHWMLISVALFFAGLLSKVMIVSLPCVLLLLDYFEGRKDVRRLFVEKLPFFSLALLFGIIALFGKSDILVQTTVTQKLLMATLSTLFYFWKIFVPLGFSVMYPYNGVIAATEPIFMFSVAIVCATSCLLYFRYRSQRWLMFGCTLYILTLIPTFFNFAKGGDIYIASDRYAYIPLIGILFLVGYMMLNFVNVHSTRRSLSLMILLIVVVAYASYKQSLTWLNSTTLYQNTLSHFKESRGALNNLGMEYLKRNEHQVALELFQRSLAVRDDPRTRINKATALEKLGDTAGALKELKYVMKVAPEIPDSYYGIAGIAFKQSQLKEAIVFYKKAIEVKPSYTNAINNLGAVYMQQGDYDAAIETFKKAIALHPLFAESYYNLGGAYEGKGNLTEAKKSYALALKFAPTDIDAMTRLALLLQKEG